MREGAEDDTKDDLGERDEDCQEGQNLETADIHSLEQAGEMDFEIAEVDANEVGWRRRAG